MRRQKANSNIALIGFSATGKSVIARKVAEHLNWGFVDTDDEIVRLSGKSISDIFEQEGEQRFRQLERKALTQACRNEKVVIATGGGAIVDARNQKLLCEASTVICLEARPETIHQRLLADALYSSNPVVRPLLAGGNPLEHIRRLKASRQLYYAIADWTVHTDKLTLQEVSQEAIRGWRYVSRGGGEQQSPEADLACEVQTTSGRCPVYIGWGSLGKLGEKMKQVGLSGATYVISDETVFSAYGAQVKKALESEGFQVTSFTVPPGEATKNIEQAIKIYDFLVAHHVERNDVIVAVGGGMVGDLAGFVAATFLRGLPWLQVPTSLVAMADASIGGKVAVDHPQGKNLIGAFYQPRLVLADVRTLTSLPQRELISGWTEVIKHGLILDAEFFGLLEDNVEELLRLTPEVTCKAIARSASIKAQVVTEDERETGKRIVLNYGHTVAHGLEAAGNYQRFLHGEAVAIGMMAAAKLSQRLGFLSRNLVERQEALLERFGLPTRCRGVNLTDVLAAMELDKKVRGKAIQWVLLENIGKVVVHSDVPGKEVSNVLKEMLKP